MTRDPAHGDPVGFDAAPASRAPDPFERGLEAAEERRRLLEALREDVRAAVRDEVRRVGLPAEELDRRVAEAVRREMRENTARGASVARGRPGAGGADRGRWLPLVGAVALVVGFGLGALGYRALRFEGAGGATGPESPAAEAAPEASVPGGSPGVETPVTGPGRPAGTEAYGPDALPLAPERRAELFDSLFAARSGRLEPLMERLAAAGPAPDVSAALSAWRAGGALPDDQRQRLHDALVQLALNEVAGAGLALDGFVTRGPCSGNSCGALLRLWRERGSALRLGTVPPDAASDDAALAVAERSLVLGRLEEVS